MAWVPFIAGIKDGFNPCMLITCAVMLVVYLWLERKGVKPQRHVALFAVAVFIFGLALNIGFGAQWLSSKAFQKALIAGYFVLAAAFLVLGARLLYNWARGLQGKKT